MNKAADNNRKGVVGSNGINMPIIPKIKDTSPNEARTYFTILFDDCLISLLTMIDFL